MSKHSKAQTPRGRKESKLETRKTFLIICEGEKTEPLYFEGFKTGQVIMYLDGTARNTRSLVDYAIKTYKISNYDEVWCVFDKDSFSDVDFNSAIGIAKARGLKVAYSHEAFELWYLLHFHFYTANISRTSYITRLNQSLTKAYKKNDPAMYQVLKELQPTAIQNAKRLMNSYEAFLPPARCAPSTTVYELVEALNEANAKTQKR